MPAPPASNASTAAAEEPGLRAEDPVDRLDDDAGLGRDVGQRDGVAAFPEQQAGGRHDVASCLRGLRRAAW